MKSVYIHIPFCNTICSYCDFCKVFYNKELVNKYLKSLENEIYNKYKNELLDTIYIGGGTPSSLSIDELEYLLNILTKLKLNSNYEYTIECNFDSINEDKLKLFKKYGINRLSFGIESIIPKNEKILNRYNDKEKIVNIIKKSRELGFNNINVDLIYAIPGEDLKDLEKDIDFILSLDIEHISTYSLIIEEHTKLYIDNVNNIDEDKDYEMYSFICNKLKKNNYNHYEISNFAKKENESKHNLCYWKNNHYYGFGINASSYIDDSRITNTRNMNKYINNNIEESIQNLNDYDKMSYEMILGLRLIEGVNKKEFLNRYNTNIEDVFNINKLLEEKLIIDNGEYIYIPEDKLYISNSILCEFIKE